MRRMKDWTGRLALALREAQGRPFAWGGHDCCLFAADCVLAMTGFDAAHWFRGSYSTALGAARKLKEYSGGGVEQTMELIAVGMGWPEIPPAFARRGDVALVAVDDGPGLGIIDTLGKVAVAVRPRGLARLPLREALRAWRVL